MTRKMRVEVYESFEAENEAEYRRRARMTPDERMAEMAVLQERRWGKRWTSTPIEKVASWEFVDW